MNEVKLKINGLRTDEKRLKTNNRHGSQYVRRQDTGDKIISKNRWGSFCLIMGNEQSLQILFETGEGFHIF